MARTLQQITEAYLSHYLGQLVSQSIEMTFKNEQQELRIRELEARVRELAPVTSEAPDGR